MSEAAHLELRAVAKSYEGGRVRALRGIDLAIARGESVAIVGPSGSGKSTLLAVLGTLERPDEGEVLLAGRSVWSRGRDLAAVRALELGFVFQLYNLVPVLSARENVELALQGRVASRAERRRRALAWLERLGLLPRAEARASVLSGGERQRVALARALVNDPPLLLADEPTGALDRASGELLLAELRRTAREHGKTLVLVTHDPAVAAACDRRLRLVDGAFVGENEA
ncbi:MAG: ABC transporter ATP-binding protein [Planctomycetes bacterium]|nr:ABC transporter ATP-binding protein [Planctomycetota bacterium]